MKIKLAYIFILIIVLFYLLYHIYPIVYLESFSNNLSIISCYFGNSFTYVHPAPSNQSYFFTNFSGIKNEVEKKGWIYCERKEEISDDILISSIQSKKIKFLQITQEYPEVFDGKDILYIDHKIHFTNDHVTHLENLSKENPEIELILCKHNQLDKKNITDEINDANNAERYRRHMPETIEFVNDFLLENNLKDNTSIYLTGMLYYHNISNIKPLLYDINKLCNELQQPECQVFMATLGQKYENYIKSIDFIDLNPSLEQAES